MTPADATRPAPPEAPAARERPEETLLRMFDEATPWPSIRAAIRLVLKPEERESAPPTSPEPPTVDALIAALFRTVGIAQHGQLCPVWTKRDRKLAYPPSHGLSVCDCWVVREVTKNARKMAVDLGLRATHAPVPPTQVPEKAGFYDPMIGGERVVPPVPSTTTARRRTA